MQNNTNTLHHEEIKELQPKTQDIDPLDGKIIMNTMIITITLLMELGLNKNFKSYSLWICRQEEGGGGRRRHTRAH